MTRLALVVTLGLAACGPGAPGGPSMNNKLGGGEMQAPASDVVSTDILAREPLANKVSVKHILISWRDLGEAFGGHQDARAQKRSKADAEKDVRALLAKIKSGDDFDALMKASSEDLGSAMSAKAFTVEPGSQLVIEFRQLSLRLRVNEVGVCQSDYGFHIIKRLE